MVQVWISKVRAVGSKVWTCVEVNTGVRTVIKWDVLSIILTLWQTQ